nr:hypothetical protein [Succinivibrio sp.]
MPAAPTRRSPSTGLFESCSFNCFSRLNAFSAASIYSFPASVICIGFVFLSKSFVPNSSSALLMAMLKAGCVMQSLSAAFEKLEHS